MADTPEWEFLGDVSNNVSDLDSDTSGIRISLEEPLTDFPIEGDGECVVCGAPTFRPPGLTRGGNRKRVPKLCDEHAPKKETTSTSTGGSKTTGIDPSLVRIAEELADDMKLLGTFAGVMYPVTGYYIIDNADPFTIALVKLAGKNPAILRVLHRAAQVAPIYSVLQTVAGVAVAVQVDMNKIDPHSFAATHTGVERAFNDVYPDGKESSNGFGGTTPPPRFRTVG